jgi:hypothetical protein
MPRHRYLCCGSPPPRMWRHSMWWNASAPLPRAADHRRPECGVLFGGIDRQYPLLVIKLRGDYKKK